DYDYVRSRGGYGIGYVMAVTLDEPLELWRVRELYGVRTAGWDGNRSIFGDPFYAMDELVRAIVPEGAYGYESVDYATYHVGSRRYRYPRYACYDGYGDWYYHRGAYWDDCDRVRILLVTYPWYYDTYRWRGPRRVYYERYYVRQARSRPLHGYKERTDSYAPPSRGTYSQRPARANRPSNGGSGTYDRPGAGDRNGGGTTARRPAPTTRGGGTGYDRPSGDRTGSGAVSRRPDRGTVTGTDRGSARTEPRTGSADRPTRGTTRPQAQDEAQPRQQDPPVQPSRDRPTFQRRPQNEGGSRTEPRRGSPPARSAEPRRESPPSRSAEPRRESPPQRSAEPRRESPPPSRSSEPSRSSSGGSSRSSAPRSRTP
ncbi:MAG TPA: hypothetical protein VF142_03195, partial [Longimicrobium sp.]